MVVLFWNEPAPRWSVLVPLGLAVVLAVAWVLASRAAGPTPGPAPADTTADAARADTTGQAPPPIPAKLPLVKRNAGATASRYLALWTPFFVALAAASVAPPLEENPPSAAVLTVVLLPGLTGALGLVLTYFCHDLIGRTVQAPFTQLRDDAAGGRVRAIRVRVDAAVADLRPHGSRSPSTDVHEHYLALTQHETDPGGKPREELRFGPMEGGDVHETGRRHLWDSVPHAVGQDAWLCWPKNWEPIHHRYGLRNVVMPAALVTDSGHIVWGRTGSQEWVPHLRERRAPLQQTDPGRTVSPPPRPSRYDATQTPRQLLVLLPAALLAVLCLTGTLTGGAAAGAVAAVPFLLVGPMFLPGYAGPGLAWMTIRDEED
ncbi:hypothetical protein ABZ348_27175 [Streptomyces sp. NPDC005963]|uniref:hypothetical protein n=1 Tax=Streptomyces sp. NPDC005963 TaxID=3156721 RepID=UPI003404EC2A